MYSGNGFTVVLLGNSADNIHDLGLIVLVQVSQDLGFAGSATGCLQERLAQQVPALNFDTLIQVCIQDALFMYKSLHFAATPLQQKLDLFTISLKELANEGGQIGPQKMVLHRWLRENNLSLVEPVILGSNLTGGVSQCRLTELVTMVDTLAIEDTILTSFSSDRELDQYLSGDEFSSYQLINLLYPEIKRRASDAEIDDLFDVLPVDVDSVKSYIVWLSTEAELITLQKKNQALRQARIILAIARMFNGHYLQRKKPSDFGRLYYEGVSVQNINKELRRAVLGNCWEYDIRSSVVAWKMGWAKQYVDSRE
ncbi:MAG: hypothetical protein EB110_12260, partial [Betaproteobacteria bacterium]|nr:hypothetical protein [Betaproteobacteria bacterium]